MCGNHDSTANNYYNSFSSIRQCLVTFTIKLITVLRSYLPQSDENIRKNFAILKKALIRENRQKKKKSRINLASDHRIFNFRKKRIY